MANLVQCNPTHREALRCLVTAPGPSGACPSSLHRPFTLVQRSISAPDTRPRGTQALWIDHSFLPFYLHCYGCIYPFASNHWKVLHGLHPTILYLHSPRDKHLGCQGRVSDGEKAITRHSPKKRLASEISFFIFSKLECTTTYASGKRGWKCSLFHKHLCQA